MAEQERNAANLRARARVQLAAARYYRETGNRGEMLVNVWAARDNWRLARSLV
jgi:hypothetical protein